MKTAQLSCIAACLALAACSSNRNEYVRLRRNPDSLLKREADRKKTPDELRWEREDLRASRRLAQDLKYWQAYYAESRARTGAIVGGVSEQPWRDYETARRETFYRRWSDSPRALPDLAPDTDGPPGWLGPRLAPSQGGTVDPNAEEAFESGDAEPSDESTDGEDEWGGDEGGDEGGDDDWGDDDW